MHRILGILIMMIISVTTAMSQQMPITVTPILTPPYTTSLSKMSESGSTSLMVNIYVGDVTITEVPVRLRIKMESHGITITSRKDAPVTPLFLGGGEARVLIGDDLKQTLQLDNLTFQGYDKTAYIKSGVLPGGLWKITVWLEHLHTGRTLSNKGIATAWMASYPPPVLTAPKQDAIAPTDILLPLTFTWQASKSVGGTASLLYTFEMWEMRTPGVPAQTIAAYTPPIITAQTSGLFHTVIPSAYAMEPGMRYCWRVTVSDPSGRASIQEGGHSEVREFQYLEKCPEVCDISITQKDVIATATWELNTLHKGGWNVEMYDDGGLYHETLWSGENHNGKKSYPHGTTWHIRVQGICQNGVTSEWSQWEDFTIPEAFTKPKRPDGTTYECGPRPEPRKITNFTEKELFPGDTIENERGTSKFEIYSAIKNSNGSYRGLMYMHLNIWGVKVMCEYDNLRVNTDGVTISNFYMVSVEYDDLNMDVDAMKAWHEQLALDIAGTTYNNSIHDTINLGTYKVNFATLVKQKGKYYAVTELGDTTDVTYSLERKRRVMVEDAKGNKLMLDRDGNIMGVEEYRASGGNEQLLKTFNAKKDSLMSTTDNITFEKVETENYGFDKWRGEEYDRDQYPTITDNNDYRPAYIGAEKEKTIRIKVNKTKGITFKSERGVPLIANEKDNTIAFNCGTTGRQAIYAYRDSTVVGKVNVQAYSYKDVKVHLVRVNGATMPNIDKLQTKLNSIFQQAVVRVTLDELEAITIKLDHKFKHGGTRRLRAYNDDQRLVINELQKRSDYNTDDFYLFFVDDIERLDDEGNPTSDIIGGYMPVGWHFGFIYNNPKTPYVAHELGHGTLALHHTFVDETETFRAPKESTDNLMDYNGGTLLNHKQWQWAHGNHGREWFEEEGEGEIAVQIAQCLTAAAIDVAANYAFKWVELWYDGTPADITDYETIFGAMNTAEVITSAGIACATSVLPIPTNKAKLISALTGAFGSGAVALAGDIESQYNSISLQYPDKNVGDILSLVDWGRSLKTAGVQALVGGVISGVSTYAATHPKFVNFVTKLNNLGYDALKSRLTKAGLSDEVAENFCKKVGVLNNWAASIGKNIDDLQTPPEGYQFYHHNGKKFIRRTNASDIETPQLTVKDGKIVRYDGKTITAFTTEQIASILKSATKNPNCNKVMLGRFDPNPSKISYNRAAGKEYTFYELDNWDELKDLVDGNEMEMWRLNKQFIEEQFSNGKIFFFSHNPNFPEGTSYPKEIKLLRDIVSHKYKKIAIFIKDGELWRLSW